MKAPLCTLFFLAASSTGHALCQEPTSTTVGVDVASFAALADERVPMHTMPDDEGHRYGLWAAGRRYKASFHDGATFVPYLGREHAAAVRWSWRTVSVAVGEVALETTLPRLEHGAFRASYDLGAIVEAYDVRDEGLEQTFVLAHRPAASGDLVIRGHVTTGLHAKARAAEHSDVLFFDPDGTAVLNYGAATAVDASGETRAMTTEVVGDQLVLRLDAAWLQTARFPVTVDPLLGVVYSNSGGEEMNAMDVLHDSQGASGNIWLATSRWASASDADLRLRRVDNDGQSSSLVFTDLTASWSSIEPSLGMHEWRGKVVLGFTRDFTSNDQRLPRFHVHDRADFSLQTGHGTFTMGGHNGWRSDVATDFAAGSPATLLIVFQREDTGVFSNSLTSDVWGSLVDVETGIAGVPFPIAQTAVEDHERPTVGKIRSGGAGAWTVAYQVIGNGFGVHHQWDINVCRVDRNAVVSESDGVGVGNGQHDLAPKLAGYNDTQVLSWVRSTVAVAGTRPNIDRGQSVLTSRLDWTGSGYLASYGSWQHVSSGDVRFGVLGADYDHDTRSHFVVTYRSSATENVYLASLGFRGYPVADTTVFTAPAGETTISGAVAYDENNNQFLVGYGRNLPAVAYAQIDRYRHPTGAPVTSSGLGCGTGQLSWIGSQLIGDAGVGVRMESAPAGSLMTVLVAVSTANLQLFGLPPVHDGCWLLVPSAGPDSIAFLSVAIGPSNTWTFDLPEMLDPVVLRLQGLHFDGSNTELFTTQRLNVPLLK